VFFIQISPNSFDPTIKKKILVVQTSAHAVTIESIVRHATLDAPRGSGGNGTDRGASPGALFSTHDGTYGRPTHAATHGATHGATA
jgi:hypothetical protein